MVWHVWNADEKNHLNLYYNAEFMPVIFIPYSDNDIVHHLFTPIRSRFIIQITCLFALQANFQKKISFMFIFSVFSVLRQFT